MNPLNDYELKIIVNDILNNKSLEKEQEINGNKVKLPVIKENNDYKKGDVINVYFYVRGRKDGSKRADPEELGDKGKVEYIKDKKGMPTGKKK